MCQHGLMWYLGLIAQVKSNAKQLDKAQRSTIYCDASANNSKYNSKPYYCTLILYILPYIYFICKCHLYHASVRKRANVTSLTSRFPHQSVQDLQTFLVPQVANSAVRKHNAPHQWELHCVSESHTSGSWNVHVQVCACLLVALA